MTGGQAISLDGQGGLLKEVILKEEPAGGRWGDLGGNSPGGNSMGKGSEVETSMACLKTREEIPGRSLCRGQEQ